MRTSLVILVGVLGGLASTELAAQRAPRMTSPALEAEAFVTAASAQGAVTRQNMTGFGAGWSGGAQLMWQAQGVGATLRLTIPKPAAGTGPHRLIVWFTRAPDYGRFNFSVEGASPVTLEGYAPAVTRDSALIGTVQVTAAPLEVRVQVVGKAPQSHGYFVGLDRFAFQSENAPAMAGGRATPGQPSTAVVGQQIGNIANDRARNQNLTNTPELRQMLENVPVVRAGAGSGNQAEPDAITHGFVGGHPALAPLTSGEKVAIAQNALGAAGAGNQSLMSLNGFQADEQAMIRLTAAEPWVQGRALLIGRAATSYPPGPIFDFWLKGGQPVDQWEPGFRVVLNPDPSVKVYVVDCDVWVKSAAIFRTEGQDVTLHAGSHHYTALVEGHPKSWGVLGVTILPTAPVPSGTAPPEVQLRSCEVTPLK
jgi:hypothetical protein